MTRVHSVARSTAVAGAALILVVGATFAHDAVIGGLPATDGPTTVEDHDIPNADFEQGAESDEDAAERPEIDDQLEANEDGDLPEAAEPAEVAKPAAAKPAKTEKHVKVVKTTKSAGADDENDNDQGEAEDNDDNDQAETEDNGDDQQSGDHESSDGEHDDGGDSHDGGDD